MLLSVCLSLLCNHHDRNNNGHDHYDPQNGKAGAKKTVTAGSGGVPAAPVVVAVVEADEWTVTKKKKGERHPNIYFFVVVPAFPPFPLILFLP